MTFRSQRYSLKPLELGSHKVLRGQAGFPPATLTYPGGGAEMTDWAGYFQVRTMMAEQLEPEAQMGTEGSEKMGLGELAS